MPRCCAAVMQLKEFCKPVIFLLSLALVALGQPARIGWLGAMAALFGFALFFAGIPPSLSKKRRFSWGTFWFTVVQLIQLSWMTSIEFQGYYILLVYFLLSLGMGFQFGLLTIALPPAGRISLVHILSCAALWTLLEWIRLFFICGFSWNPVGLALTHFPSSLQFASVFGVFGLSFWVMLTNLAALNYWRGERVNLWLFCAALPFIFGEAHFSYHMPKTQNAGNGIRLALVETALLPSQKIPHPGRISEYISPLIQWEFIVKRLKEKFVSGWDIIVLPEAVVPLQSDMALYPFEVVRSVLAKELGSSIEKSFPILSYPYAEERVINGSKEVFVSNLFWCQTLSNHFGSELVVGFDHTDKKIKKSFNSVFYLKPHSSLIERYDKQVLLPLAEYLPYHFLKQVSKRYGIFEFFSQGSGSQVFGKKILFSPSVCYEETFSEIMREGRTKGAELFVNVTNDNYFPHSSLHEQHLFHARLRAVENGIPLIRACNSGVSSAITSFGEVVKRASENEKSFTNRGDVLSCSLNSYTYPTFYSFWGDGCIISCSLMICISFWRLRITFKDDSLLN